MIKVLIVDDDPNIRKLLDIALQKAGFAVSLARDGNEAFITAMDVLPDVAVLDVMMPGLHGYELCRRLRANPSTAHTKIIFLTARGQPIDQKAGLEAGADLFLTKPVMPADLVEHITTLVTAPTPKVEATVASPQPSAPTPTAVSETDELSAIPKGPLVACFSLSSRVGVTTLATNIALALALARRVQVPLIELHLRPAGILAAMGLATPPGPVETFNPAHLESYLVAHPQGVQVFPALPTDETGPATWMAAAVSALRRRFPITIADMTSKPNAGVQAVLTQVDLILLVTTPEVEPIRAAVRAIEGLYKLQFADANILLVINHVNPQAQVPIDKIEQGMKRQAFAVIPHTPQMATIGKPIILADPRSPASQAIGRMAVRIARGLKLPDTTPQETAGR